MASCHEIDDLSVYVALKDIFKDKNSQLRDTAKIRKLVVKHENNNSIAKLIKPHGIEAVIKSTHALLTEQVFSSVQKAESKFPSIRNPPIQQEQKAPTGESTKPSVTIEKPSMEDKKTAVAIKDTMTASPSGVGQSSTLGASEDMSTLVQVTETTISTMQKVKKRTGIG